MYPIILPLCIGVAFIAAAYSVFKAGVVLGRLIGT